MMEYILCYEQPNEEGQYIQVWEEVFGEDAMQARFYDLLYELDCDEDDIMIFEKNNQI